MTDVSVVVPTHNRLALLAATLSSILRQKEVCVEAIVVDDGSSDGTGPWLERLAAADARVKVVRHESPQRLPSARNAGVAHTRGRWIAFCDDDDLWAPEKTLAQLSALRRGTAGWACVGAMLVDERLRIIGHHHVAGGEALCDLLRENTIWSGSSVVVERELLQAIGGFDPTLNASEDWDMWIRLARRSPLAAVDRPLLAYRQATGTMSTDVDRMRLSRSIVLGRYADLAEERGVIHCEADYDRFLAKQLLRAGARRKAAALFARLTFKHSRWREAPRILAASLAPKLTARLGDARAARAVPAAWLAEADVWLRPFRERDLSLPCAAGPGGPPATSLRGLPL